MSVAVAMAVTMSRVVVKASRIEVGMAGRVRSIESSVINVVVRSVVWSMVVQVDAT